MKFKTSISKITDDDIIVRGQKLSKLIEKNSFTDAIFLLLLGRNPNEKESKIFSSIFISIIDHGMGTTSSLTTRFVMSGGNTLNTAVAGGVLSIGDYHGGAIEKAMKQLKDITESEVKERINEKKVIFGFGHKIYKSGDPRVKRILNICKEVNYKSEYIDKALMIEKMIKEAKGRLIPLNVDGLIAGILLEMGFPPEVGKGIFIIGRTPGLVAQALEEKQKEKPVRRLSEEDIEYSAEH